jgi:hypothetical protein
VGVELHFERALFRNLALHGNCALGRHLCWYTCSSLTSMVTITCVSVCPHLYAGQYAAISTERAAPRSLRTGSRGSLVHSLRPPAPVHTRTARSKERKDRRRAQIVA